jgi:two-component system response regulator
MPSLRPLLVADDDPDDLFFTKRILLKAGVKNPLVALQDGEEVISFLKSADPEPGAAAPSPCLLVLDIKMPRCGGFEILVWTRRQKAWRDLKIVMLSGSDEPRDRKRAADLGANGYLVKPAEADSLGRLVAAVNTA